MRRVKVGAVVFQMSSMLVVQVLAATALVVLVAACSGVVLVMSQDTLRIWIPRLVSVAIGVLLGDAFLHLLPDAVARADDVAGVFWWALAGMLVFYGIEQCLFWRHTHEALSAADAPRPRTFTSMNLLGDGIHNFVDGVLIAGSFLADPLLGVGVTAAIVAHEIPQELSDVAVLIHGGIGPRRAVVLNVACAATCPLGALATLAASQVADLRLSTLLAFTAGGFIYIAATDLIPLLRERGSTLPLATQLSATTIGVASMQAVLWLEKIG